MKCPVLVVLLALFLRPSSAFSQNLEGLVKPGDTLIITDRQGREVSGRLRMLSADEVRLVTGDGRDQRITRGEVGRVEKPDPTWDGAALGAGIFAFGFAGGAGASCSPRCGAPVVFSALAGAGLGAVIGALADRAIPGRRFVYQAPDANLPPHRRHYTGIGALAGAGAGLTAALAGACEDGTGRRDYIGCPLTGAMLGAIVGRFIPRNVTAYRTPGGAAFLVTVPLR